MKRLLQTLVLTILVLAGAVGASAQVAPDVAPPAVPPTATTSPPPTAEALVRAAVERWEQANAVRVAPSVSRPLIRETERQLKHASEHADVATAIDQAIPPYLNGTAKYRPALKSALSSATPQVDVIIVTSSSYSGASSGSGGGGDLIGWISGIFDMTPVPSAWNLRIIADHHALRVTIAGEEGDRSPNDIYLVSGERVRVELATATGPCRRAVQRSGNKTADCGRS